ncbi:AraC family transcriptional regulator [uncultured Massilia sp.]|uniref:AraC family transcriptional regulator n=1 Tax=uncultured Massilia sp. TaxID=169973 RepID=UPI0025F31ACC|nr:AraC family transcriptional regulator [uncultured Massilia sp.]
MTDPLAEVVSLLQPRASYTKLVACTAPWLVRRSEFGQPFYAVVLEGGCHLTVDGQDTITLHAGDFVLLPAAQGFATASLGHPQAADPDAATSPARMMPGGVRIGDPDGPVDARLLVGHCTFESPDAALLVSLMPRWLLVRGEPRLATLLQLVNDETRAARPARGVVLARLLEVVLIEALRLSACQGACQAASPGVARGLADPRLAAALRCLHAEPARAWTVEQLAQAAAMSRSAFFERFSQTVGMAPMAYLLLWRMALAQRMLRDEGLAVARVAERVGYSSASTFGAAFLRHVGMSPALYARQARQAPAGADAHAEAEAA